MKVFVVGDRETVSMFQLGGIEGSIVANPETALEELKRIRRAKDYGLVIVTEEVAQWTSDWISKIRFSKEHLIILDIPGSIGPIDKGKDLIEYIREAVGIRI